MLDQLCHLIGVGVITYYGLWAVFSVLGWVFLRISPPFDRLDLWLKSKAPQPTATPRPEPPLRAYSGYDIRTR
jgi:hypothetical protein